MLATAPKSRKGTKPKQSRLVGEEEIPSGPRTKRQVPVIDDKKGSSTHVVNLRVPMQIVDDIDYWVESKNYKSRSEFVLASIRFYLDYIEYKESYNVRTFQRGQVDDLPASRFDRLRYLRGSEKK